MEEFPSVEVEKIDVITHPGKAWNDKIRMIPALKTGQDILSGILLSEEQIRNFIRKNS